MRATLADLPASLLLAVDEVCDDFERLWRRARRRNEGTPHVEAFLHRVPANAAEALRESLEALQVELMSGAEFPEVPGYTFLNEIARGPMGVVYRVRRDVDERELALKMMQSASLTLWSRPLRLLAEGEILTELRHPHIVPVESFGEHDGLHHLVMPLVPGDLRQRFSEFVLVEGRPERLSRIASLMAKVAGAVAFLHERGILHGDLKPSNILLGESGEPLVCDFGLARRMCDSVSAGTHLVGTLTYMAPEQVQGRGPLTPEADIWSLGAILYALLLGHPPFAADGELDIESKCRDPEPSGWRGSTLDAICRRCLQRDPEARFHNANELAVALRRSATEVTENTEE